MKTPAFTAIPCTGELRCGARTYPTDPDCDRRAVWHIAWLFTPHAKFSLVCEEHMTGLGSAYHYLDRHPAELNCDMPGTGWLLATPSRCVWLPSLEVATEQGSEEQT